MENGFVKFQSKNWSYAGDKGTWAKVDRGNLTVCKASKGIISEAYEAEMVAFCADHGIDFRTMRCGDKVTVALD